MPGVRSTHHVKIGDEYYLLRPGTYRKRPSPMFGSRFTTGDPDYNLLNAWQYWAQTCWVGGFGAETWRDDAMFDEGAGVDTTQHEVMILSRDLALSTGGILNNVPSVRQFIIYLGRLYCLSYGDNDDDSELWRWTGNPTYEWEHVHTFNNPCRGLAVFNGKLFIGDYGADLTYMNPNDTFGQITKPVSVDDATPYALEEYNGKLYVAMGNEIWRLKGDLTWDGSTVFHKAEGVDRINHMEKHLGFLYMASGNGHILRTDGNNTFDMWQFDEGRDIASIRSFDGRLFISVNENLDGTYARQAVLYQFSGAAVTELKRWGRDGMDLTTGRLRVHGSRLYFGAGSLLSMGDGFGVAAYDPREDGYHMFATNHNISAYTAGSENWNWGVDDVMWYGGHFFVSVRGHGIFRCKFQYKDMERFEAQYDTTNSGLAPGSGNGGWYTSSDFDAGTPGLLKHWNAITVHVDLPDSDTDLFVEYSVDGGQNWVTAGTITKTGAATRYVTELMLGSAGSPVIAPRLKYRIWLRTEDLNYSPQLRGVIVRYLPLPEPNWVWDMTLVLSEKQHLLDLTEEEPDNDTKLAALRDAFRQQDLVEFVEPDGSTWAAVRIEAMEERIPHIDHSDKGDLEYEIPISLMEMVDQYES